MIFYDNSNIVWITDLSIDLLTELDYVNFAGQLVPVTLTGRLPTWTRAVNELGALKSGIDTLKGVLSISGRNYLDRAVGPTTVDMQFVRSTIRQKLLVGMESQWVVANYELWLTLGSAEFVAELSRRLNLPDMNSWRNFFRGLAFYGTPEARGNGGIYWTDTTQAQTSTGGVHFREWVQSNYPDLIAGVFSKLNGRGQKPAVTPTISKEFVAKFSAITKVIAASRKLPASLVVKLLGGIKYGETAPKDS